MGRILPALISLFVLIALTEGNVILCKQDTKTSGQVHGDLKGVKARLNDEESDVRSDDGWDEDDEISRTELLKQRLLEEGLTDNNENEEVMVREEETSDVPSDY